MRNVFVTSINRSKEQLVFSDGSILSSYHPQDCCEEHFLDFNNLSLSDFDGLYFNLNNNNFFERIKGYGIALLPVNGYPVRIPGYGANNGYYSEELSLVLTRGRDKYFFDITDCQDIVEK